jgi:hypothetical protein
MRLAARLLLLGLVGGFELLVAWWVAHPRVSADYRRHFIDQTSACWSPPGYRRVVAARPRPAVIIPTRLEEAASCVYFPDGWSIRDDAGLWTIARQAQMALPVGRDGGRISLWLTAPGYLRQPQEYSIRQRGVLLVAGRIAPGKEERIDILPDAAAVDSDGLVALDLAVAHPARPRDYSWRRNDKRLLGLLLRRVEIAAR